MTTRALDTVRNGAKVSGRWRAFLYRRLAPWITCQVQFLGRHPLALDNKYQVNSFQDVFCDPFYWQVYTLFQAPPKLVVDLGAHCGHFSMLADVCFRTRFKDVDTEYVLIEPNPQLLPVLERNLRRSGLCPRHNVFQGLVGGDRAGTGTLWTFSKNFLSASLERTAASKAVSVPYLDLDSIVAGRVVDLLKVDIEGAEFDLVANYAAIFRRVQTLIIEIHEAPQQRQQKLYDDLLSFGLRPVAEQDHASYRLAIFRRDAA